MAPKNLSSPLPFQVLSPANPSVSIAVGDHGNNGRDKSFRGTSRTKDKMAIPIFPNGYLCNARVPLPRRDLLVEIRAVGRTRLDTTKTRRPVSQ
jgi:hypothetical protein